MLSKAQAREVAALHSMCIAEGFLSTLGDRFLTRLYHCIAADPDSTVIVWPGDQTSVTAFIAGTVDTSAMYRRVIGREWFWFSLLLAPSALSPRTLRHIVETMRYGRSSGERAAGPHVPAELLAIAVSANLRGKGVGRRLVAALEGFLAERGVKDYKVATSASDTVSNAFYMACRFGPVQEFSHHGRPMRLYVKRIE